MRVAIVGSRCPEFFGDGTRNPAFPAVAESIYDFVHQLPADAVVVSGGATGPDWLGVSAARRRGLDAVEFLPHWNRYGKRAGFVRNQTIVDDCDEVHAWWDGKSKGTKHTIDLARKAGKPVIIHEIKT